MSRNIVIADQPVTYVGLQHAKPGDFVFIDGEVKLVTGRDDNPPSNRAERRALRRRGLKEFTLHTRHVQDTGIGRVCPVCGEENCGHQIAVAE